MGRTFPPQLSGKPLTSQDRTQWNQAIALLQLFKARNGFDGKDVGAAVATALQRTCEGCGLKHASFGVPQYRPLLDTRWYRMVRNGYIIPG